MNRIVRDPASTATALQWTGMSACICSADGNLVAVNGELATLRGFSAAARTLHDFFDAAAFAAAEERLAAAAADPLLATRVFDCSVRGAAGAIAVRVHVKPLPASAGLAGATFTFVDKRDAGQARSALSSALLQNQAILDNAVLGIAVVENGRTLQANARMNTLFGYVEPGDGSVHNVAVRSLYADDATWLAARAATAADFGAGRPRAQGGIPAGARRRHPFLGPPVGPSVRPRPAARATNSNYGCWRARPNWPAPTRCCRLKSPSGARPRRACTTWRTTTA
jgi:PAS domain-containing protein